MKLRKIATLVLFGIGLAALACAAPGDAPEIDPASGLNALALAGGALMIIRARKK